LIDYEVKLNLSKSSDTDVFKKIILKLQKRVQEGVVTSLVKVKDHRGDPLNEETDSRTEIGRRKEQKEVLWDSQKVGEIETF
jgi:ribonuclease HI